MPSDTRLTEGQFDFLAGIDSSKPPVIASPLAPGGLKRNQVAWAVNATMRNGGIMQRTGLQFLCTVGDGSLIYQGGWMYETEPLNGNAPYLMLSIGGRMFQVRVDTDNSVVDVTGGFADPADQPQAYFVQGERFMLKQAGDGVTLPLIWDGVGLRRSNGLNPPGVLVREIPAATAMCYYLGHIWYAQNRIYCAGDTVGNTASGTLAYDYTDAILRVTESPLAVGGDGFRIPAQAGNIRAFAVPIALDQTLGEVPLFIGTPKQIYSLRVPTDRAAWIAAAAVNTPATGPVVSQRLVMSNNGWVSDRSIVAVNGDLWYQSLDPAIRSYFMAVRYFQTWGNTPISNPINRVLAFNDRSRMRFASGTEFQSRMYQCLLPKDTPVGVACETIGVMDLDPLSTLSDQKPPVWEGTYEGSGDAPIDFLQLFSGNFGGRERAFAVGWNRRNGHIEVWEITDAIKYDGDDGRITTYIEFPSFDFGLYPRERGGGPFEQKKLDGLDLWLDKVFGTVDLTLQFRVDEDPCLYPWGKAQICAGRTCEETPATPCAYPLEPNRELYRIPLSFGPPQNNKCGVGTKRPVNIGYKFQPVLTFKGWCRVRGYHIHVLPHMTQPFEGLSC